MEIRTVIESQLRSNVSTANFSGFFRSQMANVYAGSIGLMSICGRANFRSQQPCGKPKQQPPTPQVWKLMNHVISMSPLGDGHPHPLISFHNLLGLEKQRAQSGHGQSAGLLATGQCMRTRRRLADEFDPQTTIFGPSKTVIYNILYPRHGTSQNQPTKTVLSYQAIHPATSVPTGDT